MKSHGLIKSPALWIAVLGLAVYLNSLGGKFIWDDNGLVVRNSYIKSWSSLPQVFVKDIWSGTGENSAVYRPLQTASYAADYSLWRLDPAGYHFTNILLHILAAIALYRLINILFCDKALSALTGLLFVAHPIHTEAVSYISGRADSLSALFMLVSFICYVTPVRGLGRPARAFFIPVFYMMALFSRESAVIFPALLVLYHASFKKKIAWKDLLPVLAVSLIYVFLRFTVLNFKGPVALPQTVFLQRLPGFFAAIATYIRLLFAPFGLHMEYGNGLFGFFEPAAALGFSAAVLLLACAFINRNRNRLAFFSILWFFILLLPASNLYPINAYMAEHWLYLPSAGFFLLLAYGLEKVHKLRGRGVFLAAVLSLLACYSYLTVKQNSWWLDPVVFYERALKFSPQSARVHNNLGIAYYMAGRNDDAAVSFKKAFLLDPRYVKAYNNLGVVYMDMGRNDEAMELFKGALAIDPGFAQTYHLIGTVYYAAAKPELAEINYRRALEIYPDSAAVHNDIAAVYCDRGECALAARHFDRAAELGFKAAFELREKIKNCRK